MNLTLQYFWLSFFFIVLFTLTMTIWFYAKWHIYGPKWQKFTIWFKAKVLRIPFKKVQENNSLSSNDMVNEWGEIKNEYSAQDIISQQLKEEQAKKMKLKIEEEEKRNNKKENRRLKRDVKRFKKNNEQNIDDDEEIKLSKSLSDSIDESEIAKNNDNSKKGLDWGN